jgi:hypothetical protein
MDSQSVAIREGLAARNAFPKIVVIDLRVKRCLSIAKVPRKIASPNSFLDSQIDFFIVCKILQFCFISRMKVRLRYSLNHHPLTFRLKFFNAFLMKWLDCLSQLRLYFRVVVDANKQLNRDVDFDIRWKVFWLFDSATLQAFEQGIQRNPAAPEKANELHQVDESRDCLARKQVFRRTQPFTQPFVPRFDSNPGW